MSKTLIIGSCTFQYPEAGTKPGWAEAATDWAVAVTNTLGTLSGVNDLCITCVSILNCQCTAASVGTGVSALKFSTAGCCGVRSFVVTYAVTRTDSCCAITVESGNMEGAFNGATWAFSNEFVGCAGMAFQICDCNGQVQYFSDGTKGAGTIKFKASTLTK